MTKQLKALYETKEMLEKKAKKGRAFHRWNKLTCSLCQVFNEYDSCPGCPFNRFIKDDVGCVGFSIDFGKKCLNQSRIDETLSIIISMIQYYEEKKNETHPYI